MLKAVIVKKPGVDRKLWLSIEPVAQLVAPRARTEVEVKDLEFLSAKPDRDLWLSYSILLVKQCELHEHLFCYRRCADPFCQTCKN